MGASLARNRAKSTASLCVHVDRLDSFACEFSAFRELFDGLAPITIEEPPTAGASR